MRRSNDKKINYEGYAIFTYSCLILVQTEHGIVNRVVGHRPDTHSLCCHIFEQGAARSQHFRGISKEIFGNELIGIDKMKCESCLLSPNRNISRRIASGLFTLGNDKKLCEIG